jgi:N-acetylneuraminic acid mutarotase
MRTTVAALAMGAALLGAGCSTKSEPVAAITASWSKGPSAGLERTEVAAARVGRHIYVTGGFLPQGNQTTAAVERYDTVRRRWTRVADMPVALNHAAAAVYRGRVYVVGGYRARAGLSDETAALYRYDPRRDRWRRLRSMPTARAALAVGVIGHRLYAVGGANARDGALTTLEVYDFLRRRWRAAPSMGVAREHLAAAVARGRLYVLAGRASGRGNFNVVEAFDPRTRRWSLQPSMRKPRGGIAAATVDGRIVVLGGEEGAGTIAEVELFDPRARRWRALPDMPTPRHGLGAVSRGHRVYVLEGGDKPGFNFTDALEVLTLRGG